MPNIIQGVKVNGTAYKYDYESLENLPDPELPTCDSNDEGKVLVVNNVGEPEWGDLSEVLDCDGGDEGKTLVVNSTGEPVWRDLSEVLDCDSTDEGKILVVNSTGEPVWCEILPDHDTSYDGSDAGKVLTVATNGELIWEEGGSGGLSLPDTSSATDGDVLIVHPSVGTLEWGSPLPSYDTTSDVGKVLTITENGPEWVMPS